MHNPHLYTGDFPRQHQVGNVDVIRLYHLKDWDSLNEVVVCRDKNGGVTARFGENKWCLMPFARTPKGIGSFNFQDWDNTPELLVEFKLLAYGWLFHKSVRSQAHKYTTVYSRVIAIKVVYRFLKQIKANSLSELSNNKSFEAFKAYLVTQDRHQQGLKTIFSAINRAICLEPWLKYSFGLGGKIETTLLSKALSDKDTRQTLVIPERLSDAIYGKAIELIEEAIPYQKSIAKVESDLQKNYLKGKDIVDAKIKKGFRFCCTDDNGNIVDNHNYALLICNNQPLKSSEIIHSLSIQIPSIKLSNANDFQRYLGQLITACYIVCGGFTGMRDSELGKLTPNSYFKDNINGRDFHMLQSNTFKLGEKRETWITAPIAKQAIELASTLTKAWRRQINYPDSRYVDTLWCNRIARSKPPVLISNWSSRLQRFCRQIGFVVTQEDYQECLVSNPRSIVRIKQSVVIGQPWKLSSHQFRRSLAFYTIKYRLGSKVALKQQFKHLYLAMTEWYTNGGQLASLRDLRLDIDMQKNLDEINTEMITSKIFQQWHSDQPLSGTMGKAIIKMRGNVPHIYSSWETIYAAVEKGTLTLHGTAHSYCKNGYDCDMEGVVMPQFCVNCKGQGSIIDKDQALWWQKRHKSLVRYMELGEDISVTDKSHYITQIRAAEKVMADFDMFFTSFVPALKVMNL